MPSLDYMNAITKGVGENMSSVSSDAHSSLQQNSFVNTIKQVQQEKAQESVDGATEALLNIGASVIEGGTRTLGEIAAIPSNVEAATLLGVPEDMLNAYLVTKNPASTPEEVQAANIKLSEKVHNKSKAPAWGSSATVFAMDTTTYADKIGNALKASEDAKKIVDALSITGLVKQGNRNQLQADLGSAFEAIDEAWKSDDVGIISASATSIGETVKALVSNPLGVTEYAAESLPTALTGYLGSAGYGLNVFNDALAKYQEDNKGKLPSESDLKTMIAWSAGAATLDRIGDAKLVKAITETTKGGIKGAAKNLVGTAVSEGITEGAQTAAENKANLKDVDLKEAYIAGAIGMGAGGVISTAGQTAGVVKGTSDKTATKNKEFVNKIKEVKNAIDTGEVSKFTDTTSPTYSFKESIEVLSKAAAKNPDKQAEFYTTAKEQTLNKRAEVLSKQEELLELASKENPTNEEVVKAKKLEKEIDALDSEVKTAIELTRGMQPETTTKVAEDVEAAIQGDVEAARRSFGSFRQDPDILTSSELEAIANVDNGLTVEENTELQAHAKIQKSLESLDSVGSHIADGGVNKDTGKEMFGIRDFRDMVMSDNQDTAKAGLKGVADFMHRHEEKATNLENAYDTYLSTKKPQEVNIGFGKKLTIDGRSKNLVKTVRSEANSLRETYDSLQQINKAKEQYKVAATDIALETASAEDVVSVSNGETLTKQPATESTEPASPSVQEVVSPEVAKATPSTTSSTPVAEASVVPTQAVTEEVKDYSLAKKITNSSDTTNLVAKYFKPSNSQSVINKLPNVLNNLLGDLSNFLNTVYKGKVPEGAEVVATNFAKFNQAFNKHFNTVFKVKELDSEGRDFRDEDYVQYLIDENGEIPTDIKTAMAVGAYSWLISNGRESTYKSTDSIRSLLGLPDESYIPNEVFNVIPTGSRRTSIISSMGTSIFKTLNIKMDKGAPIDAQTRLESALGLWAYESLLEAGLLTEHHAVTGTNIKNAFGAVAPKAIQDMEGNTKFIMAELNLTEGITKTIENNKHCSSFISDVFGKSFERPMPAFKPMKATTSVTKSRQQIPSAQRKVIEEDQTKAYYLKQDIVGSFFEFSKDMQLKLLGFVSDTSGILKVNIPTVEGKNRSIERELDIAEEWYMEISSQPNDINTPFYIPITVWKQGRMGLNSKFNPQTSKLHRYMVSREGWSTNVTFGSEAENYFLLAVGEGLDIEVPKFATDENSTADQKAIDTLNSVRNTPIVSKAIKAMKEIISGENTEENQQAVVDAVASIGTAMHAYSSIVELAKYELAKDGGATEFTHALAREVDGITNGVCITTLQFATSNEEFMFKLLNRMGIFETNLTYNEWKANPNNKDSYVSLAEAWERAIQVDLQADPVLQRKYIAISNIIGSISRSLAKAPLMTSIYGAGLSTIIEHLGSSVVETIYDKLQKAYDNKDTKAVKDILNTVKELTGSSYVVTKGSDVLNFKLSTKDIKKIMTAVDDVYSESLGAAMEQDYSDSFSTRNTLNAAANLAHELFMVMYTNELSKYPEVTNEIHDKILNDLKKVTPIVNTANSKLSSNDLDTQLNTGLVLSGFEMEPVPEKVKVVIKGNFKGKKSSSTGGQLQTFSAPGAGAIPTMTQSIDAATQVQILKQATVINVHDASYIASDSFTKDKEVYNQGFLSVNYRYSIPQEISQMLYRVVTGFKESGLQVPDKVLKQALKAVTNTAEGSLDDVVSYVNTTASEHMLNKQQIMKNIVRSEQYSNGSDSAYITKKTLGSSKNKQLESNYVFDDTREIDSMTTEEVFNQLENISIVKDTKEHTEVLRDILLNVVNKTIKPFNLHIGSSNTTETIGATDGVDMFIVNQIDGGQPLSGALANGIRMSTAEVYMHELVHNVSMVGLENNFTERNELVALWEQAKKVITERDFMNDPNMSETDPAFVEEFAAATERYNHVFKPTTTGKTGSRRRSDHLHEFVALGLTNANFRKALSKVAYKNKANQVNTAESSMGRLVEGIYNWFQRLLSSIQARLLSTYGKTADKQLEELFKAFAGVDSSAKNLLKAKYRRVTDPAYNFVENQLNQAFKVLEEPVNKFKGVASNKISEAVKSGKVQTISAIVQHGYNELKKSNTTAAELFLSTVTEMRGRYNYVGILHDMKRMANKNIDRFRMQVRTDYRKAINDAFKETLTVEQRKALSYGLLKTDLASLDMPVSEILQLITEPNKVAEKIAEIEKQLESFTGYTDYYIRQAKNLGQFMMTGKHHIPNAMLNAQNIADALGSHRAMPAHASTAKPLIDTLTTLYAIQNIPHKEAVLFRALVANDVDGVTFSLNIAKDYAKKTAEEFTSNTRHLVKGYMVDKVDPNVDVRVGYLYDNDAMEAQGYSRGPALAKDPHDPDTETKYLYVNNMGGAPANIGGVAYLHTDTHKGTDVIMDLGDSKNIVAREDLAMMAQAARRDTLTNWNNRTLSNKVYASPLVDQAGTIVNYRYTMQDQTKDDTLHRDTSFDDVMGIMVANLSVKEDIRKQNTTLVQVLQKMYKEDVDNREHYVFIEPRATTPENREIWKMLPEEMKQALLSSNQRRLPVRKDVVDLLFGYQKYTLANLWKLPKSEQQLYKQIFMNAVELIFGKKAAMRVRQGEDLMQALSKAVKDIIVIKSGVVTLGNMLSNVVLLRTMGVPLADIAKGHKDSYSAMRRYKRQNQELEQVRIKLASANLTKAQRQVYESRMIELEDDMAANPVTSIIDQGLLSTIVEDVDTEVEAYKLRQKVMRKVSEAGWSDRLEVITNGIPKGLREVTKEALVMQGSNLYGFLSEAAQFSDFGARFVLYNHKIKSGMAPDVAAGYVMDIFIDYDLPSHIGVQYLNDLGLLMFSKYLVRVQRIILKTLAENPARALCMMLLQNVFGDMPDIMDSTMFLETNPMTRLANPVSSLIGAAPDLVTAKLFG